MNSFFTGQVVVCINPDPEGFWVDGKRNFYPGPRLDEMCVIRGIDSSGVGLWVVGHSTKALCPKGGEIGYHYNGFRPLVQYKNDISVFKALLAPGKQELAKEVHPLPSPHTSQP